MIGSEYLKGIKQNLINNCDLKQKYKRKDQLKSKEDVSPKEAFELYLIKNFFNSRIKK